MKITPKKFKSLQNKTSKKRSALQKKKLSLQAMNAALLETNKLIKKELAKGQKASKTQLNKLQKKQTRQTASAAKFRNDISLLETDIIATVDELMVSKDPRDQVENLNDQVPVFLMPLRIETRFMTVKHIARVSRSKTGIATETSNPISFRTSEIFDQRQSIPVIEDAHELWIRIFPDDIAIHTHEHQLTENEITAAQTFWKHIWYAGADESLRIGAWRGLVSGRGTQRAAWIARQMEPTNPGDKPAAAIDPDLSLPIDPIFPSLTSKEGSWSQAPHSRVLPERFVVRLYSGSNHREVVGERVPDDLQIGLDPQAADDQITSENGIIDMSEKLLWLKDFEEAEKVGMAIRVPLLNRDRFVGFDKLFVLGVKTSADETEGKTLLEELFDNHHYTHGGLSLVPQGTPTNNTEEKKSGYTAFNNEEEFVFDLELNEESFIATTDDRQKTDGQHLADALGVSYDVFQHINNASGTDIKEAMCMNTALWPTTMGYYLSQMMHPVFSNTEVIKTRSHFNKYVLGRGKVPSIRVDDQPYGILPTTAFSKWAYNSYSRNDAFLNSMYKNVLEKMEVTWDSLVQQVKVATGTTNLGNYHELFLEVMNLHASSVEFYQRFVSGPYFLWNLYNYSTIISGNFTAPEQANYATSLDFLQLYGGANYNITFAPRLFDFFYVKDHKYLDGKIIDSRKLSETRTIKPLGSSEENYIEWLAKSSWEQIKAEDFSNIGASGATPPNELLYLMLRHSTLLEYVKTSLNILVKEELLESTALLDTELVNLGVADQVSPEVQNLVRSRIQFEEEISTNKKIDKKVEKEFLTRAKKGTLKNMSLDGIAKERAKFKKTLHEKEAPKLTARVEKATLNVLTGFETSINKIKSLNTNYDFLKGGTLADFIEVGLGSSSVNQDLLEIKELKEALNCLKDIPTARLERAFAEHIDLSSYRLDAWFFSLVNERLAKLRKSGASREEGIYIGGYAWLENIRPGNFPGIHYREVDITPDRVLVPGFEKVNIIGDLKIENIEPVAPWIFRRGLQTNFTFKKATTTSAKKATKKTINETVAAINRDGSKNIYADNILMATGGATLEIATVTERVVVESPRHLSRVDLINLGPQYTYLGKTGVGDITYDFVSKKFIHEPRIDSDNQGYIHAPSMNHATTSAVLRAGYEAHNDNGVDNNKLAVNLSSNRVRKAMYYTEGMKNGQELATLLGYQLERGLHDNATQSDALDQYILNIRDRYPLVANRVTDTTGGNASTADTGEAYNVIDGLSLVENSADPIADYPYGITGLPNSGNAKSAIIREVTNLHDALDGINDLLLAESMHQVVQGNFARASGALNAMSGKSVITDPEVIKTPRNFNVLSHYLGIQFDLSPGGHQIWTTDGTPRSLATPYLNRWLSEMLPAKDKIKINFEYQYIVYDGSEGSNFDDSLSLADLNIEPIDLYYILTQPSEEGDAVELVNRVGFYIRKEVQEADNLSIKIAFSNRDNFNLDEISLFELQPLIDQLKEVVSSSRALKAEDFLLSTDSETIIAGNPTAGLDTSLLEARLIDVVATDMSNGQRGMAGVITDLQNEIINVETLINTTGIGFSLNNPLTEMRNALLKAALYSSQNAIPLTAFEANEEIAATMLAMADRVLIDIQARFNKAADLLGDVAAAPTQKQKLAILTNAAQEIFGRAHKVFPEFKLYNPAEYDAALAYPDYLNDAPTFAKEEWIQGLSPVRKRVHAFHEARLLSQTLKDSEDHLNLSLAQLPLEPVDGSLNVLTRWLGLEFPEDYEMPDENISFVFQSPVGHVATGLQAGIAVDTWVEEIPDKTAHTALAVHYNNPNSEPPQTCLLAVSPNLTGKWDWDDLMDTLYETLDWAKKRAIDPDLLNNTFYAQILPATYAAVSASGDTPVLDYGRNIVKKPKPGKFGLIKIQDYTAATAKFEFNENFDPLLP